MIWAILKWAAYAVLFTYAGGVAYCSFGGRQPVRRWLLRLPVMIAFGVSAKLFAFVLPAFRVTREGPLDNNSGWGAEPRLPSWLAWYDTDDASLYGDAGHKRRVGDYRSYWGMVQWLLRNGGHGFNYKVIGCPHQLLDRGDGVWHWQRPDGYWLYRRFIPMGSRTLELFFGWNLFGNVRGRNKYVCQVRAPRTS